MRAGSVRSLALGDREKYAVDGEEDVNSAFYIPVPTSGNPTEVLAERFQGMLSSPITVTYINMLITPISLAQSSQGSDCVF